MQNGHGKSRFSQNFDRASNVSYNRSVANSQFKSAVPVPTQPVPMKRKLLVHPNEQFGLVDNSLYSYAPKSRLIYSREKVMGRRPKTTEKYSRGQLKIQSNRDMQERDS